MGCELKYIDDGEGIELIFTGKLSLNDFLEAYEELYSEQNLYMAYGCQGKTSPIDLKSKTYGLPSWHPIQ